MRTGVDAIGSSPRTTVGVISAEDGRTTTQRREPAASRLGGNASIGTPVVRKLPSAARQQQREQDDRQP